jgi:hypothetical protein
VNNHIKESQKNNVFHGNVRKALAVTDFNLTEQCFDFRVPATNNLWVWVVGVGGSPSSE